jgi:large subunit ribosomal protein L14
MIQPQTYLTIADNTGARKIMCIRILGGNKKYGRIGDIIIGVVKDASPNMPIKRSDIVRAVIVRTRHTVRRKDGMSIRFDDNAAVIINKENNPRVLEFLAQLRVKYVIKVLQKLFLLPLKYYKKFT